MRRFTKEEKRINKAIVNYMINEIYAIESIVEDFTSNHEGYKEAKEYLALPIMVLVENALNPIKKELIESGMINLDYKIDNFIKIQVFEKLASEGIGTYDYE